jgi:hypothetical protein
LKWFRIRRLACNFEWLTDNLESIPESQLQEIGPYWQVFARRLKNKSAEFARGLQEETEHFGAGLGSHGRDFASGLGGSCQHFAAGLGSNANDFFTGLGADESLAFFEALGVETGAFIAALEDPQVAFEVLGQDKLIELLVSLGPTIAIFIHGLLPKEQVLLNFLGTQGLTQLIHGLGIRSATLAHCLPNREPVFEVMRDTADEFATILGEQTDLFLNMLGSLNQPFVLALGANISPFIARSEAATPIFQTIATHPVVFAQSLGDRSGSFAHALNNHADHFFNFVNNVALTNFMIGLGPHLGLFIRKLFAPEQVLEMLALQPQRIFENFSDEDMLRFAEDMGPQAGFFGKILLKRARPFAEALGELAPAFGKGLGRHARVFITNLGGHTSTPTKRDWLSGMVYGVVDYFQGNYYSRGFLKGLSPDNREAWFHAISQKTQLRIQARHRLRCSLCHQNLEVEEELQQCPACATIIHTECLHELSRGACPHDGEPARNFLETTLVQEEDPLSSSSSSRNPRISISASGEVERRKPSKRLPPQQSTAGDE